MSYGDQPSTAPVDLSSLSRVVKSLQPDPEQLDYTQLYPRRLDTSQKEIRLVSFEASSFDEIRMNMRCVSLHDIEYFEYEAMSYACDGPLIATPRNCQDPEKWLSQVELPPLKSRADDDMYGAGSGESVSLGQPEGEGATSGQITEAKPRTIIVNGCPLAVKENLYLALKRLQQRPSRGDLWIDAISISQRDLRERSEQVLLMGEIYQNAKQVHIWLGDEIGSTGTDMAVDLLEYLFIDFCEYFEKRSEEDAATDQAIDALINEVDELDGGQAMTMERAMSMYQRVSRLQTEWIDRTDFFSLGVRSDKEAWAAVAGLFERSWFWRVWTVQENMLATSATILVGEKSIPWSHFLQAISMIVLHEARPHKKLVMPGGEYRHVLDSCVPSGKRTEVAGGPQSLLHLVRTTNKRQCSDPRDRVYAVLSAISSNDPGFGHFHGMIDYEETNPVQALYTEFSRFYIEDQKDLRVLQSCDNNPHRIRDLPTWAADWHHQTAVNLLAYNQYHAAGTSEVIAEFDTTTKVLSLLGVTLDRIKLLAPPAYGSLKAVFASTESQSQIPSEVFSTFAEVYRVAAGSRASPESLEGRWNDIAAALDMKVQYPYSPGQTCAEAYWRTLLTDRDPHVQLHINDRIPKLGMISPNFEICTGAKPLPDGFQAELDSTKRLNAFIQPYGSKIWRESCGRRFFTTENGYMGLAPERAKEGDLAVVFFGGNVPFLVREEEERTLLVGECYVHGRMDGEVMQMVDAGNCEVINFTLS